MLERVEAAAESLKPKPKGEGLPSGDLTQPQLFGEPQEEPPEAPRAPIDKLTQAGREAEAARKGETSAS